MKKHKKKGSSKTKTVIIEQKEEEKDEDEDDDTFQQALRSVEYIVRIFKLLQLFCEGHNLIMQDYLRV